MGPATFRSVFGDVAVKIRRLCACCCRAGMQEPKSFSALTATGGIAPEVTYLTAKFAALAPVARVADLFPEPLPIGGAANAGTVRNHTMRVGATVAKYTPASAPILEADAVTPAVTVGLDGGYVRSRHRRQDALLLALGRARGHRPSGSATPSPASRNRTARKHESRRDLSRGDRPGRLWSTSQLRGFASTSSLPRYLTIFD